MRNLTLVFLLVLAFCALSSGQTTMTSTTLSLAADARSQYLYLASGTGVSAPGNAVSSSAGPPSANPTTLLYLDNEAVGVVSVVPPGTSGAVVVRVSRGYAGTTAAAHKLGAKVWVGAPGLFAKTAPSGSCTAALLGYLPRIVLADGSLWNCGNGQWTAFANAPLTVGAVLVSGATVAPTNPIHHVSGTAEIATITVPPALPATGGCIWLIPDAAFTTATGGNIALASTAVAKTLLRMCYSPGNALWYPSY